MRIIGQIIKALNNTQDILHRITPSAGMTMLIGGAVAYTANVTITSNVTVPADGRVRIQIKWNWSGNDYFAVNVAVAAPPMIICCGSDATCWLPPKKITVSVGVIKYKPPDRKAITALNKAMDELSARVLLINHAKCVKRFTRVIGINIRAIVL